MDSSQVQAASSSCKRKRGRPRKQVTTQQPTGKRRPGRPRKEVTAQEDIMPKELQQCNKSLQQLQTELKDFQDDISLKQKEAYDKIVDTLRGQLQQVREIRERQQLTSQSERVEDSGDDALNQQEIDILTEELHQAREDNKRFRDQLLEAQISRKKLQNAILELKGNI